MHPATFFQVEAFRMLDLQERLLTLPVMVTFVVRLIWQQLGSTCKVVRALHRKGRPCTTPLPVSQQAVDGLPWMQQHWHDRDRPLPPELV